MVLYFCHSKSAQWSGLATLESSLYSQIVYVRTGLEARPWLSHKKFGGHLILYHRKITGHKKMHTGLYLMY
jgi:hypothetical protein